MGRPATAPKKLMDGFYIEVRNKGFKTGVKIRTADKVKMAEAIRQYSRVKDVITLGEYKNGKFLDEQYNVTRR